MIHSLQAKILILSSVIFIAITASIIFFTQKDVKNAVLTREQKNIENIKNIILLDVEGKYQNLLTAKLAFIKTRKNRLKNTSAILKHAIDELCRITNANNEKKTRKKVITWLNSLKISSGIFLADDSNKIFFDTNEDFKGKNLNDIKDVKDIPVSTSINNDNSFFDKFAVFSYKNSKDKKLAYLVRLSKWGWTLGITNDISGIEAETQTKINDIIRIMKENFQQIKIANTGTIFLFNHSGDILIPPSKEFLPAISENLIMDFIKSQKNKLFAGFILNGHDINVYTAHIKVLDWYISALVPVEEIKAPANRLAERLSLIIGGIFLLGFIILNIAVKRFSNPLRSLTQKLKDIPHKDLTSKEFTLDLKNDIYIKRKDEVGALAAAFVYMFRELQKNIKQLVATTVAKERIESELNVARDIQLGILPKIFPPYPDKKEFDLYAYLEPAREVGGDLYDFFLLDDDHLCISIGDVSGKGVPAALFMAITKTLINTYSETKKSISEIMTRINDVLSKENPNCMFVTLLIGILNIKTGELKYANAGHNPPLIKSGDRTFYQKGLSGPVAGAMEMIQFKELSLNLKKGDLLFFYTDGVTEAMNPQEELYSTERLENLVASFSGTQPEEIIEMVKNDIAVFSGEEPQYDDITMLSLIFHGSDQS